MRKCKSLKLIYYKIYSYDIKFNINIIIRTSKFNQSLINIFVKRNKQNEIERLNIEIEKQERFLTLKTETINVNYIFIT